MTSEHPDRITVAIVDDNPDMRLLLRITLGLADCFVVVGEGADGREAIELAESRRPDLMLLDHHMPVLHGLDAISDIITTSPSTEVVLYTADVDRRLHEDALLSGALAVIEKTRVTHDFIDTVIEAWRDRRAIDEAGATHAGRPERRAFPRHPAQLLAAIEPLGIAAAASRCIAEELSLGGGRFAVDEPLAAPDEVRVLLDTGAGMLIVAHAQVLGVVTDKGGRDTTRVRFVDMTSPNKQRLTELLAEVAGRRAADARGAPAGHGPGLDGHRRDRDGASGGR